MRKFANRIASAAMAALLAASSVLGTAVAEDLTVGGSVDAAAEAQDGWQAENDGAGAEGAGEGDITFTAEELAAMDESQAGENSAGDYLAEEALNEVTIAETQGQDMLVWSDAGESEAGTMIITAEKKDGSLFGAGDVLIVEKVEEETTKDAAGKADTGMAEESAGYRYSDIKMAAEIAMVATDGGDDIVIGEVEGNNGDGSMAGARDGLSGFDALKIYVLGDDGELRTTDVGTRLEIMFTDNEKSAGLSDGSLEVTAIGLDKDLGWLDIESGFDGERQVLWADGGMEYLCLAWADIANNTGLVDLPADGSGSDELSILSESQEQETSGEVENAAGDAGADEDLNIGVGAETEANEGDLSIGSQADDIEIAQEEGQADAGNAETETAQPGAEAELDLTIEDANLETWELAIPESEELTIKIGSEEASEGNTQEENGQNGDSVVTDEDSSSKISSGLTVESGEGEGGWFDILSIAETESQDLSILDGIDTYDDDGLSVVSGVYGDDVEVVGPANGILMVSDEEAGAATVADGMVTALAVDDGTDGASTEAETGESGDIVETPTPELTATPSATPTPTPIVIQSADWDFDIYYVNQGDEHYVEKTNDFQLKYQMEFHNSVDIPAGWVEVRIPHTMLVDRYGTAVCPNDIGVPYGTPGSPVKSRVSAFNYYIDEATGELVFFNYRALIAGTNNAWQVLYKNINAINIIDMTAWELTAKATVRLDERDEALTETREPEGLRGLVDTGVTLQGVTKTAYTEPNLSHTPELYTRNQILGYVPKADVPEGEGFNDYVYMLWKVAASGSVTQDWELFIDDNTWCETYDDETGVSSRVAGEVIGIRKMIYSRSGNEITYKDDVTKIESGVFSSQYAASSYQGDFKSSSRDDIRLGFYIVCKYPADAVVPNKTVMHNEASVTLKPYDGVDTCQVKTVDASWTYRDYVWKYNGYIIGIDKWTERFYEKNANLTGWTDVYKETSLEGTDLGGPQFIADGYCWTYAYTHKLAEVYEEDWLANLIANIQASSDLENVASYIPGSYVKTIMVDDAVYAMPQDGNAPEKTYFLGQDDYYFSSVRIIQKDVGFDFYEDTITGPKNEDSGNPVDKDLYVYAWFEDSTDWEYVGKTAWDQRLQDGTITYTFSSDEIARHPWRVKAEHNSIDYKTRCTMYVEIAIKPDSPAFAEMGQNGVTQIQVENIDGIFGKAYPDGTEENAFFFHDSSVAGGNYSEPGILELTESLYAEYGEESCRPMREASSATLLPLTKSAAAYKSASSKNNPAESRIDLSYTAVAYESYGLWDGGMSAYIEQSGMDTPTRKEWVFYDLLPYGVQFDPSVKPKAVRLTSLNDVMYGNSCSTNMVSVAVDPGYDIVMDYRQTGRTLVKFHVKYGGVDPSVYSNGYWFDGYAISFGAYCSWEDISAAAEAPNIVAAMPETDDKTPIIGEDDQVSKDDGIIVMSNGDVSQYTYFGADINGDGETGIRNVLYAQASAFDDIAIASTSKIEKTVRAEEDRFGAYGTSASVSNGSRYVYNITVSNATNKATKDIVVYDRLENAAIDRQTEEYGSFDGSWWHGTFYRVDTSMLEHAGIAPTVYYNENRDAAISGGTQTPGEVLTEENGWQEASSYTGSIRDVKAIAVDISKMADGSDFELVNSGDGSTNSISFQVYMTAPAELDANNTESLGGAHEPQFTEWAYNNPSWYSLTIGGTEDENVRHTVIGNSAKVRLTEGVDFEIVKEFPDEVPAQKENEEFEFTVTKESGNEQEPFSEREYMLYRDMNGSWQRQDGIYATDAAGRLYLHAGEKAVFRGISSADLLHAKETESIYWEQETIEEADAGLRRITFRNRFRPFLYVTKSINKASVSGMDVSLDGLEFKFLVENEGGPLADTKFYYVEKAMGDGAEPVITGEGKTDEEGILAIGANETVALFPGVIGEKYTVTELDGYYGDGTDWNCKQPVQSGELSANGTVAEIENIYKWKDIKLAKQVTHQDIADCNGEFTFQVYDMTDAGEDGAGTLVTGVAWESEGSGEYGTVGDDGNITVHADGKELVIYIHGLEAERRYMIAETDCGEDYEPQNGGQTKIVTEPLYATKVSVVLVNDYLYRSLQVSKVVAYNAADKAMSDKLKDKRFKIKIEKEDGKGDFVPYAGKEYTVSGTDGKEIRTGSTDAEGYMEIGHDETATFKYFGKEGDRYRLTEESDDDYPQLSPSDCQPIEGSIGSEGSSESFVNGAPGYVIIRKQWEPAEDSASEGAFSELYDPAGDMWKVNYELMVDKGDGMSEPTAGDGIYYQLLGEDGAIKQDATLYTGVLTGICANDTVLISSIADGWVGWKYQVNESLYSIYQEEYEAMEEPSMEDSLVGHMKLSDKTNITYYIHPLANGIGGGVAEDASATFTNIFEAIKGSEIKKFMATGSSQLTGSPVLVWRVERYDGEAWQPAAGVKYGFHNENGFSHETGADGEIAMAYGGEAMESTYDSVASVRFYDTDVKLNLYQGMQPGDYRAVEVPEKSDSEWGSQIGFRSRTGNTGTYISPDNAVGFVNSNVSTIIKIEKEATDGPSDEEFTFKLARVLSSSGVDETVPGSGLSYTVYDKASGLEASKGVTGANGSLILRPGQEAEIYVPLGSRWKLSEMAPYPYELINIEESDDRVTVSGKDAYVDCSITRHLNDYSWEEIQEELALGTFQETFAECIENGCCKQVHLNAAKTPGDYDYSTDGVQDTIGEQNIYVNVIGVNQDEAADGQPGMVATFGMAAAKQVTTSEGTVNYLASSTDGDISHYVNSGVIMDGNGEYARITPTDYTDYYKGVNNTNMPVMQMVLNTICEDCMPEGLQNAIIYVGKKTLAGANSTEVNTYAERLFLLSADEISGTNNGDSCIGGIYSYYAKFGEIEEQTYQGLAITNKVYMRTSGGPYDMWCGLSNGPIDGIGTMFCFCVRGTADTTKPEARTEKHLNDFTWDEIKGIAGQGEAKFREAFGECIEDGCCKKVTCTGSSGQMYSVYVNILGINEDVATDKRTSAAECTVTFGMQAARPVFDKFGNIINYEANTGSNLNGCMYNGSFGNVGDITSYNGVNYIKSKLKGMQSELPDDLRSCIVNITKKTAAYDASTGQNDKITDDISTLFLLSYKEVSGDGVMASNGETSITKDDGMYEYYYSAKQGSNGTETLQNTLRRSNYSWLRSKSLEYQNGYIYVNNQGVCNASQGQYSNYGISYAFCIRSTPDTYVPAIAQYAVQLYGIGQDVDEGGNTMGLTFGPAIGGDYTASSVGADIEYNPSHTLDGYTNDGNEYRCIHKDYAEGGWAEIIAWNNEDPYVYGQCIEAGCTCTVELLKNSTETILNEDDWMLTPNGSGVAVLCHELAKKKGNGSYDYENIVWQNNNLDRRGSSYRTSRIRAMLNGADEFTDVGVDNISSGATECTHKSASIYTQTNCLLATFPEALKNAIGKKAVKSDGLSSQVYGSTYMPTQDDSMVSYDKLWLFSANELASTVPDWGRSHPLEALDPSVGGMTCYSKFFGSQLSGSTYGNKISAAYLHTSATYTTCGGFLLRSIYNSSSYINHAYISTSQNSGYLSSGGASYVNTYNAVSPGFALSTTYAFHNETADTASIAKYAVQVYGIGQDADENGNACGLTFGPALGGDYVSATKSHVPEGSTAAGNGKRCVHTDYAEGGWARVIEWNNVDPYVYEDCIRNGCTCTVELSKNYTVTVLDGTQGFIGSESGSGPGALHDELMYYYTDYRNASAQDKDGNVRYSYNNYGWGASRIRAMLNGADYSTESPTDMSAGYGYGCPGIYNGGNCLLATFPKELRASVAARRTKYTEYYSSKKSQKTSYDKLWLFSAEELGFTETGSDYSNPYEGLGDSGAAAGCYAKFQGSGISETSQPGMQAYGKNGNTVSLWLRSCYGPYYYDTITLSPDGSIQHTLRSNNATYVAPGFTLTTAYVPHEEPALAKYAVQLYGIGQDIDENGDTMGLTFGPAIGADYVTSYQSHTPSGQTADGNDGRCIHDDYESGGWNLIVQWNSLDPYVYEGCIENGCTCTVELQKNTTTTILNETGNFTQGDGSGPGTLYYELVHTKSNYENLRWHPNDSTGSGDYGTNSGGWGASRIRAMLNGADYSADTATDIATNMYSSSLDASSDTHQSASVYSAANCLFAAFPSTLRTAIGARATKYDSVYNSKTAGNLKTSYDKLWLLSPNEMAAAVSDNFGDHPLEGLGGGANYYAKFATNQLSTSSNEAFKAYYVNSFNGGLSSSAFWWWLRSSYGSDSNFALIVYSTGGWDIDYTNGYDGVSPCFALSRPQP